MVPQNWHLSKREIGVQYIILLQRLRSVVAVVSQQRRNVDNIPSQVLKDAKAWTEPRRYRVRPLWAFAILIHLVGQILGEVASRTDRCKISSIISLYLGSWEAKKLPKAAFETFMLGVKDLTALGRFMQRQRSKSMPWLAEPGQVASAKGKLVWVEAVDRKVNGGLVSAALPMIFSQWAIVPRMTPVAGTYVGCTMPAEFLTLQKALVSMSAHSCTLLGMSRKTWGQLQLLIKLRSSASLAPVIRDCSL